LDKFLDLLPIVIMILQFIACIPLFIFGRWGSGIYWFAAGLLSYTVIYGIKRFG